MTDPRPYQWAYDRSAWDARREAMTFSVGVYQWLPKVAGGLKRSATIRVSGYVADPAAVYAKADELRDRLNRERARVDDRPVWLQKSYAVAKPAGLARPRRSAGLTAAEARVIRNRVAKPLLQTAGYVQTHASTFACRRGEVVRLIHFQTLPYGPSVRLNVALQPTFVPVGQGRPRPVRWATIEEHWCTFREGVGPPPAANGAGAWIAFGSDPATFAAACAEATAQAVGRLDRYAASLARWFDRPREDRFPKPFIPSYPTTLLACADLRLSRLDAAEARLREALGRGVEASPAWHGKLLAVVARLRAAAGDPAATARLTAWLTD